MANWWENKDEWDALSQYQKNPETGDYSGLSTDTQTKLRERDQLISQGYVPYAAQAGAGGGGQPQAQPQQGASGWNPQGVFDTTMKEQQDFFNKYKSGMESAEDAYLSNVGGYAKGMSGYEKGYLSNLMGLQNEANAQAADATNTYKGTILPNLKNQIDYWNKESSSALTLAEMQDPNNRVATAVRDMYNQQAQDENRQGLADVGILQAMGAQSLGQSIGTGGPMTGAQMQLLQAGNMAQAGQAYANTQRRIQALRDQGIEKGFERTDAAYQAGLGVRDRLRQSIFDVDTAEGSYLNKMAGLEGRRSNLAEGILGSQGRMESYDRLPGFIKSQIDSERASRNLEEGNLMSQLRGVQQQLMYQQSEADLQKQLAEINARAQETAAKWRAGGTVAGGLGGTLLQGIMASMSGGGGVK
jgi:hypothetical protein